MTDTFVFGGRVVLSSACFCCGRVYERAVRAHDGVRPWRPWTCEDCETSWNDQGELATITAPPEEQS